MINRGSLMLQVLIKRSNSCYSRSETSQNTHTLSLDRTPSKFHYLPPLNEVNPQKTHHPRLPDPQVGADPRTVPESAQEENQILSHITIYFVVVIRSHKLYSHNNTAGGLPNRIPPYKRVVLRHSHPLDQLLTCAFSAAALLKKAGKFVIVG